ncbi:hypothetical protein ACR9E3_09875 [Actinomycetospora sp. C-140]
MGSAGRTMDLTMRRAWIQAHKNAVLRRTQRAVVAAHAQARRATEARMQAHELRQRVITQWLSTNGLRSPDQPPGHPEVFGLVLDTAHDLYAGCPSISVTTVDQLGSERRSCTTALSTGVARSLDSLQYQLQEGPCIDALELDAVTFVRADDFHDDNDASSWPALSREVEALGVRSALSIAVPWSPFRVGLHHDHRTIGSVNFYAPDQHAFGQSETHARMFGAWVASVVSGRAPAEVLLENG